MRRALAGIAAVALLAVGCGGGSSTSAGGGSSDQAITMRDNDFSRPIITAPAGKTVTFTFTNKGKVKHEAFIGDSAAQAKHHDEVAAGKPTTGGPSLTLEPGATGTLTYTFGPPGTLILGCHIPGHYEAGMHSQINVQ